MIKLTKRDLVMLLNGLKVQQDIQAHTQGGPKGDEFTSFHKAYTAAVIEMQKNAALSFEEVDELFTQIANAYDEFDDEDPLSELPPSSPYLH